MKQYIKTLGVIASYILLSSNSCNDKKVPIPSVSQDAKPLINLSLIVSGYTDLADNQINSSRSVKVSSGTSIQFLGSAKNDAGGVKSFSITIVKYPEQQTLVASTESKTDEKQTAPTVLRILGSGPNINQPMTYQLVNPNDKLVVTSTATNFNGMTTTLTNTITVNVVRISGESFIEIEKPDKNHGDSFTSSNGFLLVKHNPGCGVVGNDGNDWIFKSKPLPAGSTVFSCDWRQFWPKERFPDYAGLAGLDDAGSYNTKLLTSKPYDIRWHNACTGKYSGKDLYYVLSFVVSIPPLSSINESTFDPGKQMITEVAPPNGFSWVETPVCNSRCPEPPAKTANNKCPNPQLFWFKETYTSEISGTYCSTVQIPSCDLSQAKAAAQNLCTNCTIEQINYQQYVDGCH